jgi:colanic acid/amylovoran biosynthesis glycosyltransferase
MNDLPRKSLGTIAHLVGPYLPGSENYIYSQIGGMNKFESIILALCASERSKQIFQYPEIYSITETETDFSKWSVIRHSIKRSPFFLPRQIATYALMGYFPYFLNKMNEHDTVLLHAHFGDKGYKSLKLKRKARIPLVTSFYGFDLGMLPRQSKWIEKYKKLFQEGDAFIAICEYFKEKLQKLGCPEEKIKILHLGRDLNFFQFKPRPRKDVVTLLTVARFVEKKGIPILLKAFSKVLDQHSDTKLMLVGDGPMRMQIENLIHELKLTNNTQMMSNLSSDDPRGDLLKVLWSTDIFILPSLTARDGDEEGTPLSLMEAQATGMPVVSTYHAGIPETVLEDKSGFLVPQNDPNSLAEKIICLLEDDRLRSNMGRCGRKFIEENFDSCKQKKSLEKTYEEILSKT